MVTSAPPCPVRPVFVLGCPRSGTTLLQLTPHAPPGIALPPETRFVLPAYSDCPPIPSGCASATSGTPATRPGSPPGSPGARRPGSMNSAWTRAWSPSASRTVRPRSARPSGSRPGRTPNGTARSTGATSGRRRPRCWRCSDGTAASTWPLPRTPTPGTLRLLEGGVRARDDRASP
ncbi:sulfotransferase [Streptomyces pseudovenezuelae]|uniref:sulfotransferase n=1 Tax=Streptomyces pseudovenezuelae TaxID=67350 RepID=UPI0036E95052